jgi:hypothetical protein
MESDISSANINTLWLKNIYENLKKLEENMRLAREGCNSVMDFVRVYGLGLSINEIKYQNLRLVITELSLLITDLLPVLKEKALNYEISIKELDKTIQLKNLFIKESRNIDGTLKESTVTPFFRATLEHSESLRRRIILDIAPILYLDESPSIEQKKEVRRV